MFRRMGSLILALSSIGASAQEELPEAEGNTIGYPTVSAALEALSAKSGTKLTVQDGWTVIEDPADGLVTLWTFTPAGHPAYPSAVKRTLVNRDGGTHMEMSVRCEAEKAPCDDLVRSFEELNAQMIQSIRGE